MINHGILLETDEQMVDIGNLALPFRLVPGDRFFLNLRGTSTLVVVDRLLIGVDFVGGQHVATGELVATVRTVKKGE